MTDYPDPAAFSVNERPREYEARIHVKGTLTVRITADNEADAQAQADKIVDDLWEGDNRPELDDVSDVDLRSCRKLPPLFRVTRDGRTCQVNHLRPGDLPREPDESGF